MAAGRSPDGAARRAATTTTGSGSTRTIRTSSCSAGDQGAIVTVNGGETWSSWYNQPTAQFYHVSTDNAFPYRVCGGQQESGSACVSSRGDDGTDHRARMARRSAPRSTATSRPIRIDPDIVYGGKLTRFDRRTGQTQDVMPPRGPNYRVLRTAPVLFSPTEPRPALLRVEHAVEDDERRAELDGDQPGPLARDVGGAGDRSACTEARPRRNRRDAASSTPSRSPPSTSESIWAGTDDGLIHLTRDVGHDVERTSRRRR